MQSRSLRTLMISIGGIFLALVFVGFTVGEQLMVAALNQLDLTKFNVQGQNMYLAGELNTRTPEKIKKAILNNPQVTTLVLTQMPGSLDDDALYPFAEWARRRGLNTHLQSTSEIASGAVDFFLAGNIRTMEKGAKIGVHSWTDGTKQATDYPRHHSAHRLNADYISRMIGSEDFYWFTIYAAPADRLHWMTEAEIKKFKLLNSRPQTQ